MIRDKLCHIFEKKKEWNGGGIITWRNWFLLLMIWVRLCQVRKMKEREGKITSTVLSRSLMIWDRLWLSSWTWSFVSCASSIVSRSVLCSSAKSRCSFLLSIMTWAISFIYRCRVTQWFESYSWHTQHTWVIFIRRLFVLQMIFVWIRISFIRHIRHIKTHNTHGTHNTHESYSYENHLFSSIIWRRVVCSSDKSRCSFLLCIVTFVYKYTHMHVYTHIHARVKSHILTWRKLGGLMAGII